MGERRNQRQRSNIMIKFSLTQIQEKSPYEIVFSEGDFIFQTDEGIHYSISFSKEDIIFGGCETYQFIIRKIEETHMPHDSKVKATILAIIYEFFRSNSHVLFYICDTSDHREEIRNRLFLTWFEHNAEPERFTIRTANTKIEGEGFYTAIIVENCNPKLQEIIEEFERISQILIEDKPHYD